MRELLDLFSGDRRFAVTALAATVVAALVIAIPTVLVPNSLFVRMVEAGWWTYAVWLAAAPLLGISIALHRRRPCPVGRTAAGSLATVLAVGCPSCNALVVGALGASGALTYFAPVQPLFGVAGLVLLLAALRAQLRARQDATVRPVPSPAGRDGTAEPAGQ